MWFKVDDGLHDNGKVRRVDDLAAMGLWALAGSWVGQNGTDGFVPASVLRRWGGSWKRLAGKLCASDMWREHTRDGEAGYMFVNWSKWQPTAAQAKDPLERIRWRRSKALLRDRELCEAIVSRDGNQCRYCGARVNFMDKRSGTGGTYDHVDPDGPNSLGNVVVACRRCNGVKKDRTPAEAGMVLRPVPDRNLTADSAPVKSGQVEDSALTHAPPRGGTGQVPVGSGPDPGQVGSGRFGPGPFDDPEPQDDERTPAA